MKTDVSAAQKGVITPLVYDIIDSLQFIVVILLIMMAILSRYAVVIAKPTGSMEFAISSWPAFALNRLILLVEQYLLAGAIVLVTFIIMYFVHLSKMF